DNAQRSYRLAPEVKVALDARALEASIHNSQNDAQLAALDGYEGEFLSGLESEWVSQAQSRYRQMAVDLCLSLAAKTERSNPAAAIKLYHRAVDIEPFSEEAYQALVYLYEAAGNETAARLARKALEQVLEGKDPTFRARSYN
ncbi:MAG: bacterial transcriptional activator domain-containing protein, partial [Deinococcota bacterium]|nr:bacterial transcriptional activator domain-containing protein [Deinococcota bacterium]